MSFSRMHHRWGKTLLLLGWAITAYILANALLWGVIELLAWLGVSFAGSDKTVAATVVSFLVYGCMLVILIGLPWLVQRKRTTAAVLGVQQWPRWRDIALTPVAIIGYFALSAVLLWIVSSLLPGVDWQQEQDLLFKDLNQGYQLVWAFMALVVLAPLAEELIFRGYLYGKMKQYIPKWWAIGAVSLLFGLVHGQWNAGLDTFALSIAACGLREITGTIWSGVLLHVAKNGLAFYLLFINPNIFGTIGG